uniref:Uncharacterized protein n=1 Tax=Rhizophora mucronata TaxID=61149 RepID=A0A2P2PWT4_RHIMU
MDDLLMRHKFEAPTCTKHRH